MYIWWIWVVFYAMLPIPHYIKGLLSAINAAHWLQRLCHKFSSPTDWRTFCTTFSPYPFYVAVSINHEKDCIWYYQCRSAWLEGVRRKQSSRNDGKDNGGFRLLLWFQGTKRTRPIDREQSILPSRVISMRTPAESKEEAGMMKKKMMMISRKYSLK